MADVELSGFDELQKLFEAIGPGRIQLALGRTLYREMQMMMTQAKRQTPVRNRSTRSQRGNPGSLRASGTVLSPVATSKGVQVQAGFGGDAHTRKYAKRVHDNPRSGKTGGRSPSGKKYQSFSEVGKYRFLQDPFNDRFGGSAPALVAAIRRDFQAFVKRAA